MKNFSPNMLKTFDSCPVKFNLKFNEKITVPQNPSLFEKGKKIHALANYFHHGADISKLEKALTPQEHEVWERLKNNEYFSKKCLHSEYQITARLDEIWIFGRLDAIVCDSYEGANASYWILDYKTGSIPKNPEKDYQTMIYLLCADLIFSERKSLAFVYIDLKNDANKVIEFTPDLKEFYEKTLKEQCKIILDIKEFEGKENKTNCKFCEYNKICRNI